MQGLIPLHRVSAAAACAALILLVVFQLVGLPSVRADAAPDPALATPEKTWNRYLEALRAGNRSIAIGCLTSTARDKFQPIIEQSSTEQLRGMADAVRSFALTGTTFGNMAEAAVSMKSGLGGLVYFVNMNGEWRINEM